MKKMRFYILAGVVVVVVIFIVGLIQNSNRKPDEYTLIYEGDNKNEIWVDIAIQRDDGLMYLGSVLLRDSEPTMQDVVETINNSDEGILIAVDSNGIITSINGCENGNAYHWNIYINNKRTAENDIKVIRVNDYDGITLLYE